MSESFLWKLTFLWHCWRTIEVLFLKQPLTLPFLCHKSAARCQSAILQNCRFERSFFTLRDPAPLTPNWIRSHVKVSQKVARILLDGSDPFGSDPIWIRCCKNRVLMGVKNSNSSEGRHSDTLDKPYWLFLIIRWTNVLLLFSVLMWSALKAHLL